MKNPALTCRIMTFMFMLTISSTTLAAIYELSFTRDWESDPSTYPPNLTLIPVCVHQDSSAAEKKGGVIHEPNPDIGILINRVRRKLSQHWEKDTSIRFIGWEWCDELTSAEKNNHIVLFIHPDSPNNSYLGEGALNKNKPASDTDKGTTRFKPWGNNGKCIEYDAGDARNEYSFGCVEQYGLHEFGHVLGFVHEWRHPDTSTKCRNSLSSDTATNEPKFADTDVLDIFTFGMSDAYSPNSSFDKNSLMTYAHNNDSCVDVTGVRFGSKTPNSNDREAAEAIYPAPVNGTYDVGVLAPNAGCGVQEHITIFTDDEDKNNDNESSGWKGLSSQGKNTQLEFCRVDGSQFHRLTNLGGSETYGVLKLGDQCPPGSFQVTRTQDNENDKNSNFYSGNISPNSQASAETKLKFCFFRSVNKQGFKEDSLPNLGFNYGVFAKADFSRGAKKGKIYIDDENQGPDNQKVYDSISLLAETGSSTPSQTIKDEISNILAGSGNTTYRIHQANTNTPPEPKHGGQYLIDEGNSVLFDGSASFDLESGKSELIYSWDISNDGIIDSSSTGNTTYGPIFYADDSAAAVRFTVSDGMFTKTAYTSLYVSNVAPEIIDLEDVSLIEGETLTKTIKFTDPGNDQWTAGVLYEATADTQTPTITNKSFPISYTYAYKGTYPVQLFVADDDGGLGQGTFNVIVSNRKPVFESTNLSATRVSEGETVTISGAFNDTAFEQHTVTVDWGNGIITTLDHGINNPNNRDRRTFYGTYQYPDNLPSGDYLATLTVKDDDGDVATTTFIISVSNVAPTLLSASHTSNQTGEWGAAKIAIEFSDPGIADSHSIKVNWGDSTGDKTINVASGSDQPVLISHRYIDNNPGNTPYSARVSVIDDDGGESALQSVSVKITNVRPNIRIEKDKIIGNEGDKFTIEGNIVDPGILDNLSATIDLGDGTAVVPLNLVARSQAPRTYDFTVSHQYGDNGPGSKNEFVAVITATDKDGGQQFKSASVIVNNVSPVISSLYLTDEYGSQIGSDVTSALVGATINLNAAFSDAGFLDTHTATVNWGSTTVNATVSPTTLKGSHTASSSYSFSEAGEYSITLNVTDDDGGQKTKSVVVVVNEVSDALSMAVNDTLQPLINTTSSAGAAADVESSIENIEGNGASSSSTDSPEVQTASTETRLLSTALISDTADKSKAQKSNQQQSDNAAANGALSHLEKDNLVAAAGQLVKSVEALVSALDKDSSLNLAGTIRMQVMSIRELYELEKQQSSRSSRRDESLAISAEQALKNNDFASAAKMFKQALTFVADK